MNNFYKLLISIIFVFIIIFIIQNYYIEPKNKLEIKDKLETQHESFIVYKNSHRSFSIYLSNKKYQLNFAENSTNNKPTLNDSLTDIIIPTKKLYTFSKIGDKIYKIKNSNKCFIKRNDTLFLFNYLQKNDDNYEEWNDNQIGSFIIRDKKSSN